jgi:hypothetical protein
LTKWPSVLGRAAHKDSYKFYFIFLNLYNFWSIFEVGPKCWSLNEIRKWRKPIPANNGKNSTGPGSYIIA